MTTSATHGSAQRTLAALLVEIYRMERRFNRRLRFVDLATLGLNALAAAVCGVVAIALCGGPTEAAFCVAALLAGMVSRVIALWAIVNHDGAAASLHTYRFLEQVQRSSARLTAAECRLLRGLMVLRGYNEWGLPRGLTVGMLREPMPYLSRVTGG